MFTIDERNYCKSRGGTPFHPAVSVCIGGRIERELCALCYAKRAGYDALHRTPDIDERNHELRFAAASWRRSRKGTVTLTV